MIEPSTAAAENVPPPAQPTIIFGLLAVAIAGVPASIMLVAMALMLFRVRWVAFEDRAGNLIFDFGLALVLFSLFFAIVAIAFGGRGRTWGFVALVLIALSILSLFVG